MQDLIAKIDTDTFVPIAIGYATNLLLAIVILIVGYWIASRVRTAIIKTGERYERLDDTLFRFFGNMARYVLLAFVFIAVLNRFGVQTASIIALMGAGALAVGLALQGAMSNVAAGIMLLVFRPFKVGDRIEVADKMGTVEEMTLFTTILRTQDHRQIFVPNAQVFGADITNHTFHAVRGVDMTFGVSYGDDIDKTRAAIVKVLDKHPLILKTPPPLVEVVTLNDSSVDFLVRPFVKKAHYYDVARSVPELVKKEFDAQGIEIPFPHRKVIVFKGDSDA
ncbi:UNVERIFIED_CONTAM: hypothetical protein GTU68_041490 [Idotea baltica]|nr:hypothetical protein [Idotea baltica]